MASDGPGRVNGVPITAEEEEEFRALAARPDIYEAVAKSIAPSIYGSIGRYCTCRPNSFCLFVLRISTIYVGNDGILCSNFTQICSFFQGRNHFLSKTMTVLTKRDQFRKNIIVQ